MHSAYSGPGDGHQQGMGHLFTGVELLPGDIKGGCAECPPASFPSGISVDQEVANSIGEGTRFRSLELGVLVSGGENTWNRMSSRGSNQPLPPESDPTRVFERVFAELERRSVRRRAASARSRRACSTSCTRTSRHARASSAQPTGRSSSQHETTLRDIETRLQNPGTLGATVSVARRSARTLDPRQNDNAPALGKLQMDLMVMALACDLTRVASLMWTNSVGQLSFPVARHHRPPARPLARGRQQRRCAQQARSR